MSITKEKKEVAVKLFRKIGKNLTLTDHKGNIYKKAISKEQYNDIKPKLELYSEKVSSNLSNKTLDKYLKPLKTFLTSNTTKATADKELKIKAAKAIKKKSRKSVTDKVSNFSKLLEELDIASASVDNLSADDKSRLEKLTNKFTRESKGTKSRESKVRTYRE